MSDTGVKAQRYASLFAIAAVCFIVLCCIVLYLPAMALSLLSQDFVEVELGSRSPWQFFVNTAYIEPCFYYRPLWRLYDFILTSVHAAGTTVDAVTATHAVSVALHALSAVVIFLILQLLTRRNSFASALGALAYACHPAIVAIVVWISARWALYTALSFLIAALIWEILLRRTDTASSRKLSWWAAFVLGILLILNVPFVSEAGVVGMGTLGLWILFSLWQKTTARQIYPIQFVAIACILAFIPVCYFAARWNAVGCLFGGLNDVSHLPWWQHPALWLLGIEQDFNILLGPFALSVLDVQTHRDLRSPVAIALSGGLVISLLCAPFFFRSVRKFFKTYPLPLILFVVFILFQTKSLWLFVRPPVGEVGYYRGYAYVLPVIALSLLIGLIPAALKNLNVAVWVRVTVAVVLSVWVFSCALHTNRSLAMWKAGAGELVTCESLLRPWLMTLPENTTIRVEGFDDYLVRPWCQQAFVWDMTHKQIIEHWAGKPLNVLVSTKEHPLSEPDELFDGWIVRPIGTNKLPSWERVKPQPIQK